MKTIAPLLILLLAACSKEAPQPGTPQTTNTTSAPRVMNLALLRVAPDSALANEVIRYEPVDGHHFETKAPQKCGELTPLTKTARHVECQFTEPGKTPVTLNVCDDGKTYCKPVRYSVDVVAPKGFVRGDDAKILQPPKTVHDPVVGFVVNKPAAAQELAKKEDKLLFIHFFGIWCPPCNLLEEEVYPTPEFLTATEGMVRVMLDADSDISFDWKSHFKVGGYPTVIIATADLEEIDRMVGSRATEAVVKWAEQAEANRATPIAKLLAEHPDPTTAPPAARQRVGVYLAERREWDEAASWLADLAEPAARRRHLDVSIEIAKRDGDEARVTQLTQQLASDFGEDVKLSSWVEVLLEKKAAGATELVQPALDNLERWRASDDLANTGYSVADLWWKEADLRKANGDEDGAKQAYIQAAEHYAEQAKSSKLEVARGANMERAYALFKAGEYDESKALYEKLVGVYPNEFSFNYNFAYVLNELDEHDRAYEYVQKAEEHSYGDNWLRAIYLKAKIEKATGRPEIAARTIDDALAEAVVPRSTAVRTHRYLSKLRTLRAEL